MFFDSLSKLLRQFAEHVAPAEIALRLCDLVAQRRGDREVLEQRDEVGERLVKREHVGIGRLAKARVQSVQQRVRGFVRHDVVREAAKDCPAGKVAPWVGLRRRKVSEQQRLLVGTVVRVRLAHRVRINPQPADIVLVVSVAQLHPAGRPQRTASECALEMFDSLHRNRVNHLLMELRIRFRRRQTIVSERQRPIQIDRRVADAGGRIDVNHFQVFAHRTRREIVFPNQIERSFVEPHRIRPCAEQGIERENSKAARRRQLHRRIHRAV